MCVCVWHFYVHVLCPCWIHIPARCCTCILRAMQQATSVARQEVALQQLHCNWLISFPNLCFSLLLSLLCFPFAAFLVFYCVFILFYLLFIFNFIFYISLELLSNKSCEIAVCRIVRCNSVAATSLLQFPMHYYFKLDSFLLFSWSSVLCSTSTGRLWFSFFCDLLPPYLSINRIFNCNSWQSCVLLGFLTRIYTHVCCQKPCT